MPKLFLFGIGGTGSRVIKALTMLLASGVRCNADEIIPIIVDPHQNNEDLKRSITALRNYQAVYKTLGDNRQGFFANRITTLDNLVAHNRTLAGAFAFDLKGVQNERFRDYIDFNTLDDANKALASLLFSESNLETEMDIGFVGNPNIGSVVLNQFKDSDEFKNFASNFNDGDRVFIISSIFGGTGAAGFPLILKNIRDAKPATEGGIPNHDLVKNASVGAVTVMPYFGVSPNQETQIDKATFISKTKAALAYYGLNVSGNRSVNALYYIGDNETRDYPNDPGQDGQRNDAHFVELAAALSILDFMNMSNERLATEDGAAAEPIFLEFGVKDDLQSLNFTHLGQKTQRQIAKSLTQYAFSIRYVNLELRKHLDSKQPFAAKHEPKLTLSLTGTSFFHQLEDFNKAFLTWLDEMGRNKRGFAPFNMIAELKEMVNGVPPKKSLFGGSLDFNYFTDRLNDVEGKHTAGTAEQKLLTLLCEATSAMLTEKFDYFKNIAR